MQRQQGLSFRGIHRLPRGSVRESKVLLATAMGRKTIVDSMPNSCGVVSNESVDGLNNIMG
jgi:hypothetical protein